MLTSPSFVEMRIRVQPLHQKPMLVMGRAYAKHIISTDFTLGSFPGWEGRFACFV